ncbi:MAG TPA: hypothetical protein VM784_01580 [Actinomycetota bacterium]|nr:hypothetical protein [Actinomycetota bacterium]
MEPKERLGRAREQLAKVQTAWLEPTDWSDLTVYGMYACENAVVAAANILRIKVKKSHWDKVAVAHELHEKHGLPDITALLEELNELRKGFSYGEVTAEPTMPAEEIAAEIENFMHAVAALLDAAEDE